MAALSAVVTLATPAAANAAVGWSQPQVVASGVAYGWPAVGIDGNGVATLAWTTQGGVYAATRAPGGAVSKAQLIGSKPGAVHLAVAKNGDAVIAWADGRTGTTYTSVRPAGGKFGPQTVFYDPILDSPAEPQVAIASNGWAVVAIPSGDTGTTFIAAVRPPGGAFGNAQRVSDSTNAIPYHVGTGIDARGDAVVAFAVDDCPNLPPDYRCDHPVKASVAPAGGAFPRAVTIAPGGNSIPAPNIAVSPEGHATIGFSSCVGRNCVDVSQVVDGELPGPFGAPRTIGRWTGEGYGNGQPIIQPANLAALRDGSTLAWLWTEDSPTAFFAKRGPGGWGDPQPLAGDKAKLLATSADDDGDVIFYGPPHVRPCDGDCMRMRVQTWSAATGKLADPVTLSTSDIVNASAAAPGPGDEIVALWTEGLGSDKLVLRAYEELTGRDRSAPVVAVVAQPRAAAPVLRLRALCDERCTLAASGLLRVGSHAFPVSAPARTLQARKATTLRLRVRQRARAQLIRALHGGGRRTLVLRLRARDAAGNARVTKRTVRIR